MFNSLMFSIECLPFFLSSRNCTHNKLCIISGIMLIPVNSAVAFRSAPTLLADIPAGRMDVYYYIIPPLIIVLYIGQHLRSVFNVTLTRLYEASSFFFLICDLVNVHISHCHFGEQLLAFIRGTLYRESRLPCPFTSNPLSMLQ